MSASRQTASIPSDGGSAALGSDFFRYAMQAKGLGYWVEVNLCFIRPIALTTEKRIEQKLSSDRDVCIAICNDSFT